jgi:hypothetical protein
MVPRSILAVLMCSTLLVVSCSNRDALPAGTLTLAKGGVFAVRDGKRIALKTGDRVKTGERIETEQGGVALLSLQNNLGMAEIQPEAVFVVKSAERSRAALSVLGGNVWLKVNKLAKNERLDLATPTTVAGVRGTSFYTFAVGDLSGTCQCEGKTSYSNTVSGQVIAHDQDSITFTRGGRVVVLGAEELKAMGMAHNHSVLDDSPIGPKQNADPKSIQAMVKLVNERLAK